MLSQSIEEFFADIKIHFLDKKEKSHVHIAKRKYSWSQRFGRKWRSFFVRHFANPTDDPFEMAKRRAYIWEGTLANDYAKKIDPIIAAAVQKCQYNPRQVSEFAADDFNEVCRYVIEALYPFAEEDDDILNAVREYLIEYFVGVELNHNVIINTHYRRYKKRTVTENLNNLFENLEENFPVLGLNLDLLGEQTAKPLLDAFEVYINTKMQWEVSHPGEIFHKPYFSPNTIFYQSIDATSKTSHSSSNKPTLSGANTPRFSPHQSSNHPPSHMPRSLVLSAPAPAILPRGSASNFLGVLSNNMLFPEAYLSTLLGNAIEEEKKHFDVASSQVAPPKKYEKIKLAKNLLMTRLPAYKSIYAKVLHPFLLLNMLCRVSFFNIGALICTGFNRLLRSKKNSWWGISLKLLFAGGFFAVSMLAHFMAKLSTWSGLLAIRNAYKNSQESFSVIELEADQSLSDPSASINQVQPTPTNSTQNVTKKLSGATNNVSHAIDVRPSESKSLPRLMGINETDYVTPPESKFVSPGSINLLTSPNLNASVFNFKKSKDHVSIVSPENVNSPGQGVLKINLITPDTDKNKALVFPLNKR